MNISIDNRYCNRFIHHKRIIFSVNHNGASHCVRSQPHLSSRMCMSVLHSRGIGHPIYDLSRNIATRQFEALVVQSTHYITNDCIYLQCYLFASTNSLAIDLMTMKDQFLSQYRPRAIHHFFLSADVNAGGCTMTLASSHAPENKSHKNIIILYFHIWM